VSLSDTPFNLDSKLASESEDMEEHTASKKVHSLKFYLTLLRQREQDTRIGLLILSGMSLVSLLLHREKTIHLERSSST
jgi:hypothetical protein